MSRSADLLMGVASFLKEAKRENNAKIFKTVRAELDRYDFADLVKDSSAAPYARVCLLRKRPAKRADGAIDEDVSVAIVVVAGREGRPNPAFSSADLAALGMLDDIVRVLMLDPYAGMTKLEAADIGDGLVVVSEQSNEAGVCIALQEVKWRLLETHIARPSIQRAIATGRNPETFTGVAINGGDAELSPLGFDPDDAP